MKQHTRHIAMVRPMAFGYNEQTAANNYFQKKESTVFNVHELALKEFDTMVALLKSNGIDVLVLQDSVSPPKPDAIFPNNWFCCNNGLIQLFPMYAPNRRLEKHKQIIEAIQSKTGVLILKDWSAYEEKNMFLEGTGSMVIDYVFNIAYACISARTNKELFEQFCKENNYLPISFEAADAGGNEIYHTNVMMALGEKIAVVCLAAVKNEIEKTKLLHELQTTGHQIVDISFEQMNHFAGNMLELINNKNERLMVMSKQAYSALTPQQIATIEQYNRIITPDIGSIENIGGGSVRCMMAELFY